jgi:hypothetical protein
MGSLFILMPVLSKQSSFSTVGFALPRELLNFLGSQLLITAVPYPLSFDVRYLREQALQAVRVGLPRLALANVRSLYLLETILEMNGLHKVAHLFRVALATWIQTFVYQVIEAFIVSTLHLEVHPAFQLVEGDCSIAEVEEQLLVCLG